VAVPGTRRGGYQPTSGRTRPGGMWRLDAATGKGEPL
jgi:hypothetical protein